MFWQPFLLVKLINQRRNEVKRVIVTILSLIGFLPILALSDASYPTTNPTYIPSAISPAASFSAPGDYTFTTSNVGTTVLQVAGTCTSLAAVFQGSPNVGTSPTWTNLPLVPAVGGAPISAISTTGIWKVDTSGFAQTRLHITALTAACSISASGTPASSAVLSASTSSSLPVGSSDPCQSPGVLKSSVAVSQASSTTAALVAAATGKVTYVCGFSASAVGTTPTFTFLSGTQTTNPCDTGATNISGAINPSATVGVVSYGPGSTVFSSGAISRQLCLTTAATTDVHGVLTYVQQ